MSPLERIGYAFTALFLVILAIRIVAVVLYPITCGQAESEVEAAQREYDAINPLSEPAKLRRGATKLQDVRDVARRKCR